MLRSFNRTISGFLLLGDVVATNIAFIIAYFIRFHSVLPVPRGVPDLESYLKLLPFVTVIWPLCLSFQGLYRYRRTKSTGDEVFSVLVGVLTAAIFLLAGDLYYRTYVLRSTEFTPSRGLLIIFVALNFFAVLGIRSLIRLAIEARSRRGYNNKRVLIAGAGELGRAVADRILRHSELGFRVVGFLDESPTDHPSTYRDIPVLGSITSLESILRRERIDTLYIAQPMEAHHTTMDILRRAGKETVTVRLVPDLLQYITIRAGLEDLDGIPIINLSHTPLGGWNRIAKRFVDIGISLFALGTMALVFPIIAILIKLTSRGPILYAQERLGLDGRTFKIYKFRSMEVDAEEATGPIWAKYDDPRSTRLGNLLRKLSIDELPQFWNVLRGEMSVVGPRPERPVFVEEFRESIPLYMVRHRVKSGITGWAQVNGWRGDTSLKKRVEYDLYYIENWSLGLDFKIMWLTLWQGVFQRGF